MNEAKPSFGSWLKVRFWPFVLGAAITAIGVASQMYMPGTAMKMAADQKQAAVVDFATPACVQRFQNQPNAAAAWNKLHDAGFYDQVDLIKTGGFIAVPGQKMDDDTASAIASACSRGILATLQVDGDKLVTKAGS